MAGEWRKWIDDNFMEYPGDRLLWDGMMYDGTWDCPASRSNYCESGHGIGFNGREKDGNIVADIIDPNGTLHKEVWTYRTDTGEYVTSVFDMPPEMGYTLYVPYIHFTMEPHVG